MRIRLARGTISIICLMAIGACTTSPPSTSIAPAAPSMEAVEPPALDLCPLPAVAPAELRSKPGYVEFTVSAVDAIGAPITGLKQSDFVVRDGARSLPIAYFREITAKTPASLFIVGDSSVTMYDKTVVDSAAHLGKVRAALNKAAEDINDCDEVGVVVGGGKYAPNFAPAGWGLQPTLSEVTLLQPFTTEHQIAIVKMENVIPSGPSHLHDALKLAVAQLGEAHYPVRALVVMTDGLDRSAIDESAPIVEQARANGIAVMVIGIGDQYASASSFPSLKGTKRLDLSGARHLAAAGNERLGRPHQPHEREVLLANPVNDDDGASLAHAISTIGKQLDQSYTVGVLAPGASAPKVELAKPAAMLRAEVVPSRILSAAAARPPPPPQPPCVAGAAATPPATISSKPGYAQVRVSVFEADGSAVRGLKQSDFAVSSASNHSPVVYLHEDSNGGAPRSLVIAIDSSGSMQPKLPTVRRELGKFLQGLNPCDEVALLAFSGRVFQLQTFTTDHRLVEHRLALLHAYGATGLYDAISRSLEILSKAKYPDRAVILLTDGMDNVSKISGADVLTLVSSKRVPIYAIGIGEPMAAEPMRIGPLIIGSDTVNAVDKATLDTIALRTGGTDAIVPPMSKDRGKEFARAVATLGEELERGYEVGFVAPSAGATPTITVTNHSDYVVHLEGTPSPSSDATTPPAQVP